jgi:hypothetical protein
MNVREQMKADCALIENFRKQSEQQMKDWRGNDYKEEELNCRCEICNNKMAVRNCCCAEGDIWRTHWHGAVHTKDGGLKNLCRECADKENKKWSR